MPVGTSFENSAMKASFSLSSLQAYETPEKCVKPRMYNSLTKNRSEKKTWRRSWGSSASDQKDDFWSALQANYNYIMDNHLIDNCEEANGELIGGSGSMWSLKEFIAQFSELYSWLNSVQEAVYGKEENITDKALRAHCMSTVLQKKSLWKLFNEQASQLVQLYPEVQEEVNWRVTHLNCKWDSILSILGPSDCGRCEQETCLDIDHEVKCLRKWIKNMEICLPPLDLRAKFTKTEIEAKALELMVLHRDIENHSKIINSVVKLCKRADASCSSVNVRRVANGLERRWHLLFLRSLEWQCYIESLSKRDIHRSNSFSDSDYEGEPVTKHPRLSGKCRYQQDSSCSSDDSSSVEDDIDESAKTEGMQRTAVSKGMISSETVCEKETNKQDDSLIIDSFASFAEDSSQFTKSNRKGPNLATYYFKHEDTDSEMEKLKRLNQQQQQPTPEVQTVEETSEDEWTYSKVEQTAQEQINKVAASKSMMQDIRRLVQEAEELVSPDKNKMKTVIAAPLNKITRVKEWLDMERPEDSCDASGEDDGQESQTSEDFNESVATFRAAQDGACSQNTSFVELDHSSESPPKIALRHKYNLKGNRPWSVSCISQLSQAASSSTIIKDTQTLSISESALHQLTLAPTTFHNGSSSITVQGNNSTSSTMEEGGGGAIFHEEKASPARRKRLKFKKKSYFRKSESNVTCCNSSPLARLTKSGSFSGCGNPGMNSDRHTSSDPSAIHFACYGNYETSTTSGADSDEERLRRFPSCRTGSKAYPPFDLRDNSPGKSSINAVEEQSSSLSEQAWDSYQEKYLSEAYSETHDSDAARRLLEFGEDYRNFLDSQSDWSQSTNPELSPPSFRRKILVAHNNVDSDDDDDVENMRQLLQESRESLVCTRGAFRKQFALGLKEHMGAGNEIVELLSTCDRHISLLNLIEKSPEEYSLVETDRGETSELLAGWQTLREQITKMQAYRDLEKEILVLKNELIRRRAPPAPLGAIETATMEELSRDIDIYTAELTEIVEFKSKLLTLNVAAHRFMMESKDYDASSLKADVSDLYVIWHECHFSANERVARLNTLLQNWQMLENRLEQLQDDLREDKQTLALLDSALQGGTFSNQMASVVRDVAKLLSETKTNQQGKGIPELFIEGGSVSDSGISDEGSEHELGERERRLAAIRRLVRQLEGAMSPDTTAKLKVAEKLASAEEELKNLQKRCRSLIVRTAVSAVAPPSERGQSMSASAVDDGGGDPAPTPGVYTWFRRVIRASIPLPLAVMALLCVAYLLEPQCCDNMNTFSFTLTPQLRYVRGPPPV